MLINSSENALLRCIEHQEISAIEIQTLFRKIMMGEMSPVLIAALTIALRVKKESIGEITAAAQVMREFATKVPLDNTDNLLDIVGTGGDGAQTFNISTTAMFVAAAAGVRVAKHGGRSVSSFSGSANVLEELGANINLMPEQIAESIAQTGIGFMFAPNHHGAMKHAAPVRKELGIRTIFNILGPLANPANAPNILMGVFHPDLVGIQVRVLQRLGAQHALVVWGHDNMDEVSLGAPTMVGELINGEICEYEISPEEFGFSRVTLDALKVSGSVESKQKIIEALTKGSSSPARDIVILNAGTALYAANAVTSIADGIIKAREVIDSGAALEKLAEFVRVTQQLGNSSIR
jgi:anthranilate phosphoribosyltransferase